jgi:ATP-dependent RNA helicase RhlE
MTFTSLGLAEPLLRALDAEGYSTPTPIQARAIPVLLEGRDLLGIAQTGTGKTAAFVLPILQHLSKTKPTGKRPVRALILAPTRELAVQIGDSIAAYGRNFDLRYTVILGGVGPGSQIAALQRGVDIVVATPGRLLDHAQSGYMKFDQITHFVLDEADRMFDMGFIKDVRRIIGKLPKQRQTMFFSATMPTDIAALAAEILNKPERIEVTPKVLTVEKIDQRVYFVDQNAKRALLDKLLADPNLSRVIVFTRTKHRANRVSMQIERAGISTEALHGNKSQNARQKALDSFKAGKVRVLVATDIAARGIDVDGITHVINFELPNEPESYVHRIGRTARAGAEGIALSFCDASERAYLKSIERLTRQTLTVVQAGPLPKVEAVAGDDRAERRGYGGGGRTDRGRNSSGGGYGRSGGGQRSGNRNGGSQGGGAQSGQRREREDDRSEIWTNNGSDERVSPRRTERTERPGDQRPQADGSRQPSAKPNGDRKPDQRSGQQREQRGNGHAASANPGPVRYGNSSPSAALTGRPAKSSANSNGGQRSQGSGHGQREGQQQARSGDDRGGRSQARGRRPDSGRSIG